MVHQGKVSDTVYCTEASAADLPFFQLLRGEGNVLADDGSDEVAAVLRGQPLREGGAGFLQLL